MTRNGVAAAAIIGLALAAGPAGAELPNLYKFAKTMPEALQQANQAHQARKLSIHYERQETRKEFRRAFIACRGNDACEDAAEAARDARYQALETEFHMSLARLAADEKAIKEHFLRSEKLKGTVAKPKK